MATVNQDFASTGLTERCGHFQARLGVRFFQLLKLAESRDDVITLGTESLTCNSLGTIVDAAKKQLTTYTNPAACTTQGDRREVCCAQQRLVVRPGSPSL